jgi:hypothetical protein
VSDYATWYRVVTGSVYETNSEYSVRQCTYDVTLWRVRVTIVANLNATVHSVYCWAACHIQQCSNIKCCTKKPLCRICVAGNSGALCGLHVKWQTFSPIATKYGVSRLIFLEVPYRKFNGNRPLRAALILRIDGRIHRHDAKLMGAFRDCDNVFKGPINCKWNCAV